MTGISGDKIAQGARASRKQVMDIKVGVLLHLKKSNDIF